LIEIAKDLAAEPDDYLNEQERAFYDALAQNESAIEVMSNEDLRIIATELVATVRNTAGQDWWRRENIRGKMRAQIRRILKRYGYPPDLQVAAVSRVIRQAEALSQALGHTT
jgi:type I restriction enzyme R subunit